MDKNVIEMVVEYTHKLVDSGLSTSLDSGDLSYRDPKSGLIYIDPRPSEDLEIKNWKVITNKDIVVIDIDGNILNPEANRFPTVEWPMHLAIYKARPDINAIVHSHALYSSVFAICKENIPSLLAEQELYVGGDVVCAEYASVGSQQLADNILTALGNRKAALLQNHGAIYIGDTLEDAFIVAEYTEKGAQTVILARAMGGKLVPLDKENLIAPEIADIADISVRHIR
jgi:L-ribulose-5-phosphate 4-epimerase